MLSFIDGATLGIRCQRADRPQGLIHRREVRVGFGRDWATEKGCGKGTRTELACRGKRLGPGSRRCLWERCRTDGQTSEEVWKACSGPEKGHNKGRNG